MQYMSNCEPNVKFVVIESPNTVDAGGLCEVNKKALTSMNNLSSLTDQEFLENV